MSRDNVQELEERIARVAHLGASGNGATHASLPDAEDLDWLLFHSFPGSELDPGRLAALLPRYEQALEDGATFDFELLFVRALELGTAVPDTARDSLARTSVRRMLANGFDPADAVAALRFAVRVLDPAGFLQELRDDPACERLRFHITADFTLDERALDDYLALSYLREGDHDADRVLQRYPVPPAARRLLAEFLAPAACRRRLEAGFRTWTAEDERELLARALEEKFPGFASDG